MIHSRNKDSAVYRQQQPTVDEPRQKITSVVISRPNIEDGSQHGTEERMFQRFTNKHLNPLLSLSLTLGVANVAAAN